MSPEDKEILLKDLCARLQYGVVLDGRKFGVLTAIEFLSSDVIRIQVKVETFSGPKIVHFNANCLKDHLPYLRPMSDMTEEEFQYIINECCIQIQPLIGGKMSTIIPAEAADTLIDFYNRSHLDYRGLISKGLALEAPKGMYK